MFLGHESTRESSFARSVRSGNDQAMRHNCGAIVKCVAQYELTD
jgi:hypothetical protein